MPAFDSRVPNAGCLDTRLLRYCTSLSVRPNSLARYEVPNCEGHWGPRVDAGMPKGEVYPLAQSGKFAIRNATSTPSEHVFLSVLLDVLQNSSHDTKFLTWLARVSHQQTIVSSRGTIAQYQFISSGLGFIFARRLRAPHGRFLENSDVD